MKLLVHRNYLVFLSIVLLTSIAYTQNEIENQCGTVSTTESINFYNSIKPQLKALEQDFIQKKLSKKESSKELLNLIPIKVHIIRNSDGSGGLDSSSLENTIANLNNIYAKAYMQFYLYEDINFINNNALEHFNKKNEKSLIEANYVSNIINIYFIDYVENEIEESLCGYTNSIGKNNVIVIKNSCASNNSTLAHEMGHFFSLEHTHGTSNSKQTTELVDGSNCDTDGDGICDTPADPKLSSNTINNFCEYTGNLTDANGDYYKPDTGNIMSYSRRGCRNHFTEQQFARMHAYYKLIKDRITTPITDLNPVNDATINALSEVTLYPNPVANGSIFIKGALNDNALQYQISNYQGQILAKGITSNKAINVNELAAGAYLIILEDSKSRVIKRFIK
ncbi:zinc-dependent metalloprotease [Algibacter pectinivorans]|uniref:Por secretion system C-terminal sorting domain-containing protein n=1 Tax=Algibacter pectinivorans TaxID=870482 RepID=A0A1I1RV52_9FLAO|nr:zinc-dependent metalloprotease [Algibacter pectinivorans]SFD38121.1 Por secretion system C-terminal sorting domain-containing protein [Algibacter pectinivorans]